MADHYPPCIAGEVCGEPANCPPRSERKPRARKPRTPKPVELDPRTVALDAAAEIARKRQADGDR